MNNLHPLVKTNLIFLLFFLIFGGMYFASAFLIPFIFAAILAMLLTPLCRKMEGAGINKALSAFLCVMLIVFIVLGVGAMLSAQIASFTGNIPQFEQQITQKINELQQYIQNTFGISLQKQADAIKQDSSGLNISTYIFGFLGSFANIMTSSLLTLVYIFLLLYYRSRFPKFILMVVSDDKKEKAQHVIDDSSEVAQQYLTGRGIMMLILAVEYSIGLMIVGLQNALFIAVLAALLSIIPYVGNIIGGGLALLMALVQGGDTSTIIGVLIVFTITQLFENYVLEPLVVGAEVDIHPFFTIVIIVIGGLIWGIAGMILAIPMLAILKIIFSNIESLHPYAYLIGDNRKRKKPEFVDKVKEWFS
ncbi:MAG TPA: AI-2E family transporter [Balneolaceae bacterium]